jgi:hypothetical protein
MGSALSLVVLASSGRATDMPAEVLHRQEYFGSWELTGWSSNRLGLLKTSPPRGLHVFPWGGRPSARRVEQRAVQGSIPR